MKKPWLLVDCNYLCYRAYFSIPKLSHEDIPTSVVFGFLREILQLQQMFSTTRIAFCFDYGRPLRKRIYPDYKANRSENKTAEEIADRQSVREQATALRKTYLPMIGYQNILFQKGYEADDMIATAIDVIPRPREIIIVSSDEDLFQLLSPRVTAWLPGRKVRMTEELMREEYKCGPGSWADVKAIAGCSSDNVQGIYGVGPKTAAEFICGRLKKGKKYDAIVHGSDVWKRNIELVRLPFEGVDKFDLVRDEIDPKGWAKLIKMLGMKSIEKFIPGYPVEKTAYKRATFKILGNK